ncbi:MULTISPECIES: hypothetical protein [Pseudoalteromonas]|uniref:Uncharacterized protein n=1 Tax=Pseudoalteromonas viridis TaxID=339617 RepID=A0ABX7UYW8_9GAMM|nr:MULTISPECIES: hypothetical protein [Pseudoalteromonas]QTL33821.1 hypothetical protein J5X90_09325 [Pseudoalteromonas viridis]
MIRLMFLLPILLCLGWYYFLRVNGVPLKQGKRGFIYILAFSTLVLGFFVLMMHLTNPG